MGLLSAILLNVILPVFSLIAAGVLLHRKFSFDMNTLSKLTTYFLMPAVSFANVYQSSLAGPVMLSILGFLCLQSLSLMLLASLVAKYAKFDRGLAATFKNSVVLFNSGNFGLPVSQFVFQHNPIGASVQIVVLIFQNLMTYTYGLFTSVSVANHGAKALYQFLKNPVLYAFGLGLTLHLFSVKIPGYLWSPLETTSDAFLAVALVTLGAQSAYVSITRLSFPLVISLIGRLVLSPVIAFTIICLLGIEGVIAQALFIASSFPTSRNSALFALEFNNRPELAAQITVVSTIGSILTVTIVVYLSNVLF
ncbi:AEC family transporter [Peribacillus sp. SCS-155]|uniref:AEC family transporter n=1 Tax=Peribacillus sedimenti TaxID=3115297 RepID=UPI0039061D4B